MDPTGQLRALSASYAAEQGLIEFKSGRANLMKISETTAEPLRVEDFPNGGFVFFGEISRRC